MPSVQHHSDPQQNHHQYSMGKLDMPMASEENIQTNNYQQQQQLKCTSTENYLRSASSKLTVFLLNNFSMLQN